MRKHESLYKRNRNERACSCRAVHVRQKVLKGQRKNRQLFGEEKKKQENCVVIKIR